MARSLLEMVCERNIDAFGNLENSFKYCKQSLMGHSPGSLRVEGVETVEVYHMWFQEKPERERALIRKWDVGHPCDTW